MQKNKISETENIRIFAGFDFLDLCLLGETGTGKTHTARLIHDLSPRAKEAFIGVNCAELNPSIIESELFGYEKGAFTGADSSRMGKFEAAVGGTLFLDEIGELPPNLQAKLLKVVEEKCVTRVGGTRSRMIDVRILYATNRDIEAFREDLRYRIAAHTIRLLPLRERKEEIVPLARIFLRDFEKKSGHRIKASNQNLKNLEGADWHGNVRELRSFIEKACLEAVFQTEFEKSSCKTIELTEDLILDHLSKREPNRKCACKGISSENLPTFNPGEKMGEFIEKIETQLLKQALKANNHNQTLAARELGISRSGLIKKLKRIDH